MGCVGKITQLVIDRLLSTVPQAQGNRSGLEFPKCFKVASYVGELLCAKANAPKPNSLNNPSHSHSISASEAG